MSNVRRLSELLKSQKGCCFYCGQGLPLHLASIEHLVPLNEGGKRGADNVVACCRAMNHFLGPIPLKLKVRIVSDVGFMAGITKWCKAASARQDRATPSPDACEARVRAGEGVAGQAASYAHDTHDDPSCSPSLTE
jgi:hypothetical protein